MNNKGSTLIELLIAIAILALVTAPFHKSITSAMGINYKSQNEVEANLIAQEGVENFLELNEDEITLGTVTNYTDDNRYEYTETFELVDGPKNFSIEADDIENVDTGVVDVLAYMDSKSSENQAFLYYFDEDNLGEPVTEEDLINGGVDTNNNNTLDSGVISYPLEEEMLNNDLVSNPDAASDVFTIKQDTTSTGNPETLYMSVQKMVNNIDGMDSIDDVPHFYVTFTNTSGDSFIILVNNNAAVDDNFNIKLNNVSNLYKYTISVYKDGSTHPVKEIVVYDEK